MGYGDGISPNTSNFNNNINVKNKKKVKEGKGGGSKGREWRKEKRNKGEERGMDWVDRDDDDDADMDYGDGKGDGTSPTSWISTFNPYSSTAEQWSRPQDVGSTPTVGNKQTTKTETFPKTFLRLVFLCLDVDICIFLYFGQADGTVYRFEDTVNQFAQFSWTILYSKKQIGKQYHWRCLMIFCICFYVFYGECGCTVFFEP